MVRIGILGVAKIAPAALIKPARRTEGAHVVAVAARDQERRDILRTSTTSLGWPPPMRR